MPTDMTPDYASTAHLDLAPPRAATDLRHWLRGPEWFLCLLILATGGLSFALSLAFGQPVAWDAFLISFAPSAGLILLGAYVRACKDMPRAGICAIATGIYIGFSGVVTILIYLRFPIATPLLDETLMALDARLFGYDWERFTAAIAAFPALGRAIGWVYGSSLMQLFAVIFILGYLGRATALYRVLITGTLSLLLAVAFWWAWPSLGPSAYVTLPADTEQALGLIHGQEAGARLRDMAQNGNAEITPAIIMGTIAFPSYHTVMACLVVFFVAGTVIFWPMLLLNLAMLPAILSHGGHHFSDLLGGLVAFGLAYGMARLLVRR
ncbi:hypothetical protein BOO69_15615 [Sulfitobacter alexandrii]|uniref:Inositolphosphotransferase Aur1/Ipt1 domain-containing protein n=1 Tax=Sulfitobacter alexandrii TaxID=1917485 RepID=A0A1J0WK46_9RHOB|nr:phosphatase PAP2 family protein [Sulfitobacter alexandrii]APE44675.1 hypothetical protein BOO69_15615 [Sulfitobacter alexandrii]